MTKINILFVDDDPAILDAIKRNVRKYREEWTCYFVISGLDAIKLMQLQAMDVIVSDMRMPHMSGLELLTEVKRTNPGTLRIILSGFTEIDFINSPFEVIHQFLNKPCDLTVLRQKITAAMAFEHLFSNDAHIQQLNKINTIPTPPKLYQDIVQAIEDKNFSFDHIGDLISENMALSIKVLQLVNSSYFSLNREICSVKEAVVYLGMETVQSFVLSCHVFSKLSGNEEQNKVLLEFFHKAQTTSLWLKKIYTHLKKGQQEKTIAQTVGVLHNLGDCIKFLFFEDEVDINTPEVGSFLMTTWGLPVDVIYAVLHQNDKPCKNEVIKLLNIAKKMATFQEVEEFKNNKTMKAEYEISDKLFQFLEDSFWRENEA